MSFFKNNILKDIFGDMSEDERWQKCVCVCVCVYVCVNITLFQVTNNLLK